MAAVGVRQSVLQPFPAGPSRLAGKSACDWQAITGAFQRTAKMRPIPARTILNGIRQRGYGVGRGDAPRWPTFLRTAGARSFPTDRVGGAQSQRPRRMRIASAQSRSDWRTSQGRPWFAEGPGGAQSSVPASFYGA